MFAHHAATMTERPKPLSMMCISAHLTTQATSRSQAVPNLAPAAALNGHGPPNL